MIVRKIYYINLQKDCERRSAVEANIERVLPGVSFERIEAIGRADLVLYEDILRRRLTKSWMPIDGKYPKPGGIGCYLSHELARFKISNDIQCLGEGPSDFYMVLEDDCVFGEDFSSLISNPCFCSSIPEDARLLKPVARKFDASHKVNDFFYDVSRSKDLDYHYYFGAHMLLYRASCFHTTSAAIDRMPVFDIDWLINKRLDGVYAFGSESRAFVTQSNFGGSNTLEVFNG